MSNNDNTDELVQQIATAIAPIIQDYVDDQLPDPDPGDIDLDKLATLVAERIGDTEIDIDELADLVADRIDTAPGEGLTEAEVIALIEQHASSGDNGTGDWGGDLAPLVATVTASLGRLQVSYDPQHIGELDTGTPHGEQHASTGFGPVYEAEQVCHLRGTVIDAAEAGTVTFRFYELEDGDFDTEIADEPYRTREIDVESGEQYIPLDVTLDEGYYFVEKDAHLESASDDVTPLRRATGVDPEDVNTSDVPLNWVRGWHPDYRPSFDEDAYERFRNGDWSRNYHYCYNIEVGY
jgi:hypothetical protein